MSYHDETLSKANVAAKAEISAYIKMRYDRPYQTEIADLRLFPKSSINQCEGGKAKLYAFANMARSATG